MKINKVASIGFSLIFSVCALIGNNSSNCCKALNPTQKIIASEIQDNVLKEWKLYHKIKRNEKHIENAERKISKEKSKWWFFRSKKKILKLENSLNRKKKKRECLDEKLAVIFQLREAEEFKTVSKT